MSAEAAERGTTRVADRAVRRIATRAAARSLGPSGEVLRVAAEPRGGRSWRLRLDVGLAYPAPLESAGARLQEEVTTRTAELTGLTVGRTEVRIGRLTPRGGMVPEPRGAADAATEAGPGDSPTEAGPGGAARAGVESVAMGPAGVRRRVWRPWSERRVPAAVVAGAGAVLCGVLLADVVAVALGSAASGARIRLLGWLAAHGPGDTVVTLAGAVAVVAGLGLLVAGVAPGLRGRLAMVSPDGGMPAAIDRSAARALVHHGVAEVRGVSLARVRVGRRAVVVRATVGFGALDEARAAVRGAAAEVVDRLALARPVRIRVRVSPDAHWRAPGREPAGPPLPDDRTGAALSAPGEKEGSDASAA
ncbi:DUF6286 domain-containing protein [Streptomyces sp. NPDC093085]|uniref:DUF6286 domain-containing protein n=1 Tax=Streptomyces sp. NPDC093085 TaxID=3155068 RepID=UPI00342C8B51